MPEIKNFDEIDNIFDLSDDQLQDELAENPREVLRKLGNHVVRTANEAGEYPQHGPDDRMVHPKKYGGIQEVIRQRSKERKQAARDRGIDPSGDYYTTPLDFVYDE